MKVELRKEKYYTQLCGVGAVAESLGYKCYVVGGYVRDLLLSKDNDDLDFVVEGSGLTMAKEVAKFFATDKVSLYENYGTAKVDVNGVELEFVGARKEFYHRESRNPIVENGTIQDDMDRRDLTINDIAICLNKDNFGEVFDPHNGVEDLKLKIIRTPLDPNITFSDDPLRMLRAIRFASRFDFRIDPLTFKGIKDNAHRIKIITQERITTELEKMITGPNPSKAIWILDCVGLLEYILPEIFALKGREIKNGVTHKDIFEHSLKVLENISYENTNEWVRWAALFHDVGKPKSKKWEDNKDSTEGKNTGQWTFYDHASIGAKMIPDIFKRMSLPLDDRMVLVQKLVANHMYPMNLCETYVTDSAIRRLLFNLGDDIDNLMDLCNADITSSNKHKVNTFHENYIYLIKRMKEVEEKDHIRNFQPPIDGNEIMEMFNLKPCKIVGLLKESVKEAILDGFIQNNYDSAKKFVINKYNEIQKL